MMRLQGNHDCLIIGFPVGHAGTGFDNSGGKFMPEGDLREDRFVSFMIEPGVKIGSADSAVGDTEQYFVFLWGRNG